MKLQLKQDPSKRWDVPREIAAILLNIAPDKIEVAPVKPRRKLQPCLTWSVQRQHTGPVSGEWYIHVSCANCQCYSKIRNYTGKSGKPVHSCCGQTHYAAPPEIATEYFDKKKTDKAKANPEGALVRFLSSPREWDGRTDYERGDPQ